MAHVQKRSNVWWKRKFLLDAAFELSHRAIRNNTSDYFSQPLGFLRTRQDTRRVLPFCLCECVFTSSLCRLKFIMAGRRLDVENESKTRLMGSETSCKVNFGRPASPEKKETLDFLFLSSSVYSLPHSVNKIGFRYCDFSFLLQVLNATL